MKIVTINHNNKDDKLIERILYQQYFTCIICDINISIYNTDFVYMLI